MGDAKTRALRRQARQQAEAPELKQWRKTYTKVSGLPSQFGFFGRRVKDGPLYLKEYLKEDEQRAELVLCGLDREKRMCNECLFARGHYNRRVRANIGSLAIPVVKGRILSFYDAIDRYFPGLAPESGPLESTFLTSYNIYSHKGLAFSRFPTYMVQLACYRTRLSNAPRRIIRLPCNKCLLNDIGAEALGELLYSFWLSIAEDAIGQLHRILNCGWILVDLYIRLGRTPWLTWENICDQWDPAHLNPPPVLIGYPENRSSGPVSTSEAFAVWKNYVECFLKPTKNWDEPPTCTTGIIMGVNQHSQHSQLKKWTRDYYLLQARVARLGAWSDELKKDPSPLVHHALREHARFVGA